MHTAPEERAAISQPLSTPSPRAQGACSAPAARPPPQAQPAQPSSLDGWEHDPNELPASPPQQPSISQSEGHPKHISTQHPPATLTGSDDQSKEVQQAQDGWEIESLELASSPLASEDTFSPAEAQESSCRAAAESAVPAEDLPDSSPAAHIRNLAVLMPSHRSCSQDGDCSPKQQSGTREGSCMQPTAASKLRQVQHDGWDDAWSPVSQDAQHASAGSSHEGRIASPSGAPAASEAGFRRMSPAAIKLESSYTKGTPHDGWEDDWSPLGDDKVFQTRMSDSQRRAFSGAQNAEAAASVQLSTPAAAGADADENRLRNKPAALDAEVDASVQLSSPAAASVVPMHACWASLLCTMVDRGCMEDVFWAIDSSCGQPASAAACRVPVLLLSAAESAMLIAHTEQVQGMCSPST